MDRYTLLRVALLTNAVFSLACGFTLIAVSEPVAATTGLPAAHLPGVGWSLLPWAAFVGWLGSSRAPSSLGALAASMGDLLWVAGTGVGLALAGGALTGTGVAATVGVAAAVGALGLAQLVGIRRCHADPDRSADWYVCVAVDVDAAPDAMWAVVRDLGSISAYTPKLAHSEADGPAAPGTVRRCSDVDGHQWRETCVAVEPGRSLTLRFETEAEDFPFPMDSMVGGWRVEARDAGSRVSVWWSFDPRPSWAGLAMVPVVAAMQRRDFRRVIARMASAADPDRVTPAGPRARLVPAC